MIVLAVDPGSRNTGIVVRRGEELLGWRLHVRKGTARMPDARDLRDVLRTCTDLLTKADVDPRDRDAYTVGVETVAYWPEKQNSPRRRNQADLYGTSMVYAAVLVRWVDAVVVDSGRGVATLHPLSYPAEIRPPVNGAGKDRLNHVRAAWDHSHAAESLAKRRETEQLAANFRNLR